MYSFFADFVCVDVPKKYHNTISRYSIMEKDVYGKFRGKEIYDLIEVDIIRLPKKEYRDKSMETLDNELLRMLNILLASDIPPSKKEIILQDEHNMKMTKTFKRRKSYTRL